MKDMWVRLRPPREYTAHPGFVIGRLAAIAGFITCFRPYLKYFTRSEKLMIDWKDLSLHLTELISNVFYFHSSYKFRRWWPALGKHFVKTQCGRCSLYKSEVFGQKQRSGKRFTMLGYFIWQFFTKIVLNTSHQKNHFGHDFKFIYYMN